MKKATESKIMGEITQNDEQLLMAVGKKVFIVSILAFVIVALFSGKIVERQLEKRYGIDIDHVKLSLVNATKEEPIELVGGDITSGIYFYYSAYEGTKHSSDVILSGYTTFYLKPIASTKESDFYAEELARKMDTVFQDIFPDDDFVILYDLKNYRFFPMVDSLEELFEVDGYKDTLFITVWTTNACEYQLEDQVTAALKSNNLGGQFFISQVDQETINDIKSFGLLTTYAEWAEEARDYLHEKFGFDRSEWWYDMIFVGPSVYPLVTDDEPE